jgi:hypothetical protein
VRGKSIKVQLALSPCADSFSLSCVLALLMRMCATVERMVSVVEEVDAEESSVDMAWLQVREVVMGTSVEIYCVF